MRHRIEDEIDEIKRYNASQLDANGIVRDGGSQRVPMLLMDAADPLPIEAKVADAFERGYKRGLQDARRKTTIRDPFGRLKESREEETEEDDSATVSRRQEAVVTDSRM